MDDCIVGGQLRVGGVSLVPPIKEGDEKINGSMHAEGPIVFGAPNAGEGGFDENVATVMIARTTNVDYNASTGKNDCTPANRSLWIKGNTRLEGDGGTANALNITGNTIQVGNTNTTGNVDITGDGTISGNWTIGGTMKAGYATWSGSIVATTKLFDIQHPTLGEGTRLAHACLEGPENGVYHRGRLRRGKEIILPSYWKGLVHRNSISVQLQPVGAHQDIIVKRWDDEKIYLQSNGGLPIDCFYHVYGERKDINCLSVEYKGDSHDDYSDEGNIYPNIITG